MNGGLATLWVVIALLFVVYFCMGCFTLKYPSINTKPLPPDSTTTTKTDTIKGQDLSQPIGLLSDKISKAIDEQKEDNNIGKVFSTYGGGDGEYYKDKWLKSVDALKEIAAEFNAFKASYKPCVSTTTTTSTKVNKHDGGAANNSNGNLWGSIGSAITAILAVVAIIMAKNKKST